MLLRLLTLITLVCHHIEQTSGSETIDSTTTAVNNNNATALPTGADVLASNAAINTTTTVPTAANINKATESTATTDKDTAATGAADTGKCTTHVFIR
jgi:hypothetical protein